VAKNASSNAKTPEPAARAPISETDRAGAGELAGASPAEIRAYISPIAGELAALARSANLGTLAYLLEMARDEAKNGR
jgi:hypothetical protein